MRIRKYFIESLKLSILFSGISVSFSQLFLFISLVLWLFQKDRIAWSPLLKASVLLYAAYFISALVHIFTSGFDPAYLRLLPKSELKDLFLFSGFIVMQALKKEDFPAIKQAFTGLMIILVVTGFISVFSQVRLSRLVSDLYAVATTWKFQHHLFTVKGIHLYLPIGMMNTHLTFGGLLLLFFPFAFYKMIDNFSANRLSRKTVLSTLFFIMFALVFLLNNARSAMGGAAIGILTGIYHTFVIKKKKVPGFLVKSAIIVLLLVVTLPFAYKNQAVQKVLSPVLGEEKHTDSGRTFIWQSTFLMIRDNPLFGIGPGNFSRELIKTNHMLSEKYSNLLFFYEVTPHGHAHNDFFHLFAIAGIMAAGSYLLLSWIITGMAVSPFLKYPALFYALPGFFFAGILQCYFQDDEVVIVFWLLTGFMNVLYGTSDKTSAAAPESAA